MSADISEQREGIESAYLLRCHNDPMLYFRGLTIPGDTGPRLFNDCMADFQKETFSDLAPSLIAVRNGTMPPKRRFWIERTKKASKDGDIAVAILWLLTFPTRPLYMQTGAADRDQAAIVKRRMHDILYHNRWLEEFVELKTNSAESKNGLAKLDILAADIAGSHGETPDVLFVNELSHVRKWEFIENMMDNARGVPQGLVIIATNAGFKGTKAEVYRQEAIKEWSCHILSAPAPWHTEATLAEAKRTNSPSRYSRLWKGRWASGKGDAFAEDQIDRIFDSSLQPLLGPQEGWMYIIGIDLGISHDHAGVVALGVHIPQQRLRVAQIRGFEPSQKTGEVDLIAVEDYAHGTARLFRAVWIGYDPNQAVLMAQRLRAKGLPCYPASFAPKGQTEMATSLITVAESGRLQSFEDFEGRLRRDLGKLSIAEKQWGYKLEAASDEFGHADVGIALCICLPKAMQMLGGLVGLTAEDDVALVDDSELTKKEIEEMPQELREIMESCGPVVEPKRSRGVPVPKEDDNPRKPYRRPALSTIGERPLPDDWEGDVVPPGFEDWE